MDPQVFLSNPNLSPGNPKLSPGNPNFFPDLGIASGSVFLTSSQIFLGEQNAAHFFPALFLHTCVLCFHQFTFLCLPHLPGPTTFYQSTCPPIKTNLCKGVSIYIYVYIYILCIIYNIYIYICLRIYLITCVNKETYT